jgi:hypothetical protein
LLIVEQVLWLTTINNQQPTINNQQLTTNS